MQARANSYISVHSIDSVQLIALADRYLATVNTSCSMHFACDRNTLIEQLLAGYFTLQYNSSPSLSHPQRFNIIQCWVLIKRLKQFLMLKDCIALRKNSTEEEQNLLIQNYAGNPLASVSTGYEFTSSQLFRLGFNQICLYPNPRRYFIGCL